MSVTIKIRSRLSSVGDSAPPSESSDGSTSETYEHGASDWHQTDHHQTQIMTNESIYSGSGDSHMLSPDLGGAINDNERVQVESFFSGLGTEVYVCPSLANLYENVNKNDWRLKYTGVPVLLHDKGSARSRAVPRVTFILAERGTCFALWQDTIDNLSSYRVAGPAFHTMCLSSDHTKVIGFSYDSSDAANEIWLAIERLISNPENISLSVPGRKRKPTKRPKPAPLPQKSQISQPCQFSHVTSVTTNDQHRYFSLQAFVGQTLNHREH